jgi:hypothetical protein
MKRYYYTIGIIFENSKELSDLLKVVRSIQFIDIKVKIISTSNIYHDKDSNEILNKLRDNEEVIFIEKTKKKFNELTAFQKFLHVKKVEKKLCDYFQDVNIVLSGIQTVFERVLYKNLSKKKIPFLVYHRHLIFGSSFKKSKLNNVFLKKIINKLNMNEWFSIIPNVGFGDKYLVLGELNKKYLLENGISSDDICITGSLEYDDINKYKDKNIKTIKNSICYITGAYEWHNYLERENNQKFKIQELITFTQNNNYDLTIRVHPRENKEKYLNIQKNILL